MSEITITTVEKLSPEELAGIICENCRDQDTIFELIKALEEQIADFDFLERLNNYFSKEYDSTLNELDELNE